MLEVDDDTIDILALLAIIADKLWLLVLGPLVVGALTYGGLFLVKPVFTAKAVVMLPMSNQGSGAALLQSLGSVGSSLGAGMGIKNPSDQIVALLKSRSISDRMLDRFDLMTVYQTKLRQNARRSLEGSIRVMAEKNGLISIEVDDTDPKRVAAIANAYPQELSRLLDNLAVNEAKQRRQFFEKQVSEAKDNLMKAELALKAGGIDADVFKSSPQAAVTAAAQLRAQIAAQEVKLGVMRGYMTESAAELRQAMTELDALRVQKSKLEGSQASSKNDSGDYVTRFREFKYYETLVEMLSKQYEFARLNESQGGMVIQVIDSALVPETKSKPKKALITVVAAMATGFVLLLYIFIAHGFRSFMAQPENAQKWQQLRWVMLPKRR